MTGIENGVIVTMGLALIGGLIWLIRLEGRVNLNESRTNDLHSDLTEIKRDIKTLLERSFRARSSD